MQFAFLVASWLLAAPLLSQHVWIVDKLNRPGTDFTSLQAAVDAVAPGDVLRLRITTSNMADAYAAPVINNKAVSIVGEMGASRPMVAGHWLVQGVASTQRLVVSHVTLIGLPFVLDPPTYQGQPFYLNATSCPGAIVLDDVVVDPTYGAAGSGNVVVPYGNWFVNCALVVVQRCSIACGGFGFANSTLVMTDTTFHQRGVPYGLLVLQHAQVTLMGSWLDAGDATGNNPFVASPAIEFCGSDMRIGGGSHIEGGRDYNYGLVVASATRAGLCGFPTGVVDSSCSVDPSVTVLDTLWPSTQNFPIAYDFGPLTSITQTQTPTTFTVTQQTTPQSVAVLAIGDLAPQPWTNIVGPAFLDPATASVYFDPSPATGPLVRSFTIPPGLPPGFAVMLQAFELQPGNRVVTSNVTFAGIW